jgi:hypothetical protein
VERGRGEIDQARIVLLNRRPVGHLRLAGARPRRAARRISAGARAGGRARGARVCLDYLSRPEAFARLYPKLLDGYLLDAIERLDVAPVDRPHLEGFVGAVTAAPRRREPSTGLGDDVRLSAKGLVGSGLELDGELLQLSAFTTT